MSQHGWQPVGESVIYQDGIALVTTARLQTAAGMFPVRGITAVQAGQYVGKADYTVTWGLFGAVAISCVLAFSHPAFILAILLFGLAGVISGLVASGKPVYTVMISTSGMQQVAVSTLSAGQRDAIVAALHRAVAGV